jgi:hypothetical protein
MLFSMLFLERQQKGIVQLERNYLGGLLSFVGHQIRQLSFLSIAALDEPFDENLLLSHETVELLDCLGAGVGRGHYKYIYG